MDNTTPEKELRLVTTLKQLSKEELTAVYVLFARGYTVRYIARVMEDEYDVELTNEALLSGGVQYAPDIDLIRQELAEDALRRGLARKEERIRRLDEVAEAFEPATLAGDVKKAAIYLKTLDQIHAEVEPLGLLVHMDNEDPWKKLLNSLKPSHPLTGALPPGPTNQP